MRADTARTVSVESTRPAKESVQNGVTWRRTERCDWSNQTQRRLSSKRRHRPHRGGEHVGDDGVHPEEADQDTEDGQAGDGGDAGHGGVAQELDDPTGLTQCSRNS